MRLHRDGHHLGTFSPKQRWRVGVAKSESLIEASVEWQGTVLDVRHFPASSGLPQDYETYEGMSAALGRLERGGVERVSVGPLSLSVRYVRSGESVPRRPLEWAPLGYVGVSMALAGMLLALMALVPPRGQAMSVPDRTLAGRLVSFETQPLEWLETQRLRHIRTTKRRTAWSGGSSSSAPGASQ